jgi:hypothetical protein
MCFGLRDQFPEKFSDEHGMVTLQRDHGPIPESRKPSGTLVQHFVSPSPL